MRGENTACGGDGKSGCFRGKRSFLVGEVDNLHGFNDYYEFDITDVHNEALAWGEYLVLKVLECTLA